MGKRSSGDLRVRIYGEIERDQTCRAAARRYGVAPSTVVCLAQRKARTGSLAPERQGRPVGSGSFAAHVAALIGWVEAEGDITMSELAARLLAEHGVKAHPASLSRLLHPYTISNRQLRAKRSNLQPSSLSKDDVCSLPRPPAFAGVLAMTTQHNVIPF